MTNSLLTEQQEQLAAIEELIRKTSSAQEDLKKSVSEKRELAEKEQMRDLEDCESTAVANREATRQKKESDLELLVKRRTLEPKLLLERHEKSITEINLNAKEIEETTEAKLNEATWLAESVFEGAISRPREEAKDAHETLLSLQEELTALCEEAPKALSRMRQSEIAETNEQANKAEKPMDFYVSGAAKALKAIQTDQRALWFVGLRPLYIVLFVTAVAVVAAGAYTDWEKSFVFFLIPVIAMLVAIGTLAVTYVSGQNSIQKRIVQFSQCVSMAKLSFTASGKLIDIERREHELGVTANRDSEIKKAEEKYLPKLVEIKRLHKKDLEKEKKRFQNVEEKLSGKIESDAKEVDRTYESSMQSIDQEEIATKEQTEKTRTDALASIEDIEQETMLQLITEWDKKMIAFQEVIAIQSNSIQENHPAWSNAWDKWTAREESTHRIPVGTYAIDLATMGGTLPTSDVFSLHGDSVLHAPFATTLPNDASILISSSRKKRTQAIGLLQNAMIRTLTALPAGKAKFTLIDPVGLGQSFAGVLHLADYEESQLLDRAWTEPRHIETQLARLTEHMETVIQKYLRNDFESIDAYNEQAGEIAEPYRFLVIADLPNNFSETAVKRLTSIITSGARCGVHVIIHRDISLSLPTGIDEDTLNKIPLRIIDVDDKFCIDKNGLRDFPLTIEQPPDESTMTTVVKIIGDAAQESHRVEVPFNVIAPKDEDIWSMATNDKVTVPLGKAGATKLQNITLGRGTAQHSLIAGKTGSGKSTLLHVLITNLALWYSPDEVEFYLVDFKKGVEFKTYATHKLPHARVVAVESDREFGISVLQKIDAQLKHRGELFRDLGVQDIAGFREKSTDRMPRILLIIDEFQEFFVDDDRVAQEANLLLDRLVRQGRAFGIHAIMGSQTLDGAYTLSRSTMGQMAVRIALQCSEQDSYIILNEDNAAARLLSRPGEAIYNDAAGNVEGNSPFQVVWLNDKEREVYLEDLTRRDKGKVREMVVYEGNQPVYLRDNTAYKDTSNDTKPVAAKIWLGGAMAIKEDTFATIRPASASNVLIVGQQDETTTGMIASTLASLQAQYNKNDATFTLLDGTPADSSHAGMLKKSTSAMECSVTNVGVREVEGAMATMHAELQRRMKGSAVNAPDQFLIINAMHRYRDLRRNEDDYGFSMNDEEKAKTPAQVLAELLKEGPTLGMHTIITTDTLANLNRALDRQSIREFDMRVLLQMGGNDSTNLIDMPDASKLGMHRALLYSEETGTIEPFRPYALSE
jgi:S-DNA-T family DNA segregation ATPase FtsK/SpoIIIE